MKRYFSLTFNPRSIKNDLIAMAVFFQETAGKMLPGFYQPG